MTGARRFAQVDVFSATPYLGNPVAVVLDGDGLSERLMQRIARWTNLSETVFVLPPTRLGADYRVRIYTPEAELPTDVEGAVWVGGEATILVRGTVDA